MEPRHPSDILAVIKQHEPEMVTLEDIMSPIFDYLKVSGIGITVPNIPDDLRLKLFRRYGKRGRIFSFHNESVARLAEFRNHALFLVTEVKFKESEELLDAAKKFARVGVYHIEYNRYPKNVKLRFKPWEIYHGEISIGVKKYFINWLMRVPTYRRNSVMFLCSVNDLERKDGNKTIFPIESLVAAYRENTKYGHKPLSITKVRTIPLFK